MARELVELGSRLVVSFARIAKSALDAGVAERQVRRDSSAATKYSPAAPVRPVGREVRRSDTLMGHHQACEMATWLRLDELKLLAKKILHVGVERFGLPTRMLLFEQ